MPPAAKDRIRLTIPVSPQVHAVFTRLSEVSGLPVGRCMGEWLEDTIDSAQLVAAKVEQAKRSPVAVLREIQGMMHGYQGEVAEVLDRVRQAKREGGGHARAAGATGGARPKAPSSNTGLNYPSGSPVAIARGIVKAVKKGARR